MDTKTIVIETCPGCGCEAEKATVISQQDRKGQRREIGYVDSCGARVVHGLLVGSN